MDCTHSELLVAARVADASVSESVLDSSILKLVRMRRTIHSYSEACRNAFCDAAFIKPAG